MFYFFPTRKKSVLGTDDDDDDDDAEMFIPGFTLMKGMRCAGARKAAMYILLLRLLLLPALWHLAMTNPAWGAPSR